MFHQIISRNLIKRSIHAAAPLSTSAVILPGATIAASSPQVSRFIHQGLNNERLSTQPTPMRQCDITSTRSFSSGAAYDLAAIIERELSEEEENTSLPPTLSDLKKSLEDDWTIVDSAPGSSSSAVTKMIRKNSGPGAPKVTVIFHCQDTITDDTTQEEMLEEGEVEEEEEVAVAFRFRVSVAKAGQCLVFDCVSDEGETNIEGLVVKDGDDDTPISVSGADKLENLYQGPEFSELAEDLQETLANYLREECGIDSDVATFVAMYSDFKEQSEYVSWLKGVHAITSS